MAQVATCGVEYNRRFLPLRRSVGGAGRRYFACRSVCLCVCLLELARAGSVSNSYLRFEAPQSFLAAMTFGNCGYSFPAVIGAKVCADRPH